MSAHRRPAPSTSPLEGEVGSPLRGEPDGGRSNPNNTYTPHAQARARELRQNMTDAERRLWSALRASRLQGIRFRRQQPIGPYIVDFFCAEAKLIIELDGVQHYEEKQFWHDYHRTKWLEARGYQILRVRNYDALKHTASVTEGIWQTIRARQLTKTQSSPLEGEALSPQARAKGGSDVAIDRPPSVAPTARRLPPQGGKCFSSGNDEDDPR